MDPNAPGGQPQYPQQPAPAPQQQWYGSYPGQPGQYPPSDGQPSAFAVPPAPKKRGFGRFLRPLIGIVVVAVIGIGVYAWNHQDNGKVVFSSTVPAAEQCKVGDRVTEIKAGSHVYFTGIFTEKLDGSVTLNVTKDGQAFADPIVEDAAGYDCLFSTEDLGPVFTEAGTYKFEMTHDGKVVATGTLTVK